VADSSYFPSSSGGYTNDGDGTWRETFDEDGNMYFFNTATQETAWERPAATWKSAARKVSNLSVLGSYSLRPQQQQEEEEEGRQGNWSAAVSITAVAVSSGDSSSSSSSSAAAPLGTWQESYDEQGNLYYYNTATEETAWERPEETYQLQQRQASSEQSGWEGGGGRTAATATSTRAPRDLARDHRRGGQHILLPHRNKRNGMGEACVETRRPERLHPCPLWELCIATTSAAAATTAAGAEPAPAAMGGVLRRQWLPVLLLS